MLPFILGSLAASAIGAGFNAYQNSQAQKLADQSADRREKLALMSKYEDPVANSKPLLSIMDRRLNKTEEAIANDAAAGGATVENVLAAKQASNDVMADTIANLAQGQLARRDAADQRLLNIDMQRTAQQIAAKQASGQAWGNLGNSIAGGLTTLGGVKYEADMFKKLLEQ